MYVPEKLAVECPECGYRGRRKYDPEREPPSCGRCGHYPLHIGFPRVEAMRTKRGGLGGRRILHWTEWR